MDRQTGAAWGVTLAAGDGRIWGMTGSGRPERTFRRAAKDAGRILLARAAPKAGVISWLCR